PGALYRYFPSKTDIIRAFVEEERSEAAALFERLEGARDFRPALAKALEETIAAVADETYGRLALEIAAEGARDPEIAAILAESEADAFARLTAAIKRAQKQGQVAESIDAKASARVLLMLVDGATGSAASPPVSKAKFRAALSRMLEGLF
ncbi:MAG: TetR family transcriptional regulator C-terminal domain-containing protein, partial [Kiloniellales bacterium]|nr:TetR family transcriptional regulator C-terminal domain-containing protein [Kiloniellales bacterium]